VRRIVPIIAVALGLIVAGCSSGSDANVAESTTTAPAHSSTTTAAEPTTVTSSSVAVTSSTVAATTDVAAVEGAISEALEGADRGVIVLIERGGVATLSVKGTANAAGDPITVDTPFRVASISKTFVAVMILQLADEGRLDLDDPLSTVLPDAAFGADVSVRSLLAMRSGLPAFEKNPEHLPAIQADLTRTWTPEESLATFVDESKIGPADTTSFYSSTNYILLAQVIERLDGTDLNISLTQRIAGPLELTSTVFAGRGASIPDGLPTNFSHTYRDYQDPAFYESQASAAWGAGSLISTTTEIADFLRALFGGQLVSDEALTQMTTPLGITYDNIGYGLGLEVYRFGNTGQWFGHSGKIPGFRSQMAFQPSTGDLMVILTNASPNIERFAMRVATALER
jgi:D-alanyl-D-alanine carboxypeptidase